MTWRIKILRRSAEERKRSDGDTVECCQKRALHRRLKKKKKHSVVFYAGTYSQTTPIGGRLKIVGGNSYWSPYSTNRRNHWQRNYYENGVQNKAASDSSRKKWFVLPIIVTFWGYISRKWSQKNSKWICLGEKRQFGGRFNFCPLPRTPSWLRHWLYAVFHVHVHLVCCRLAYALC